ncbi:MAG: LysR family transcriptional regulator [Actinomycetales bacterium]|nr:MAG: LysR family transcriptional regulator [Actinomycetales bacterium]
MSITARLNELGIELPAVATPIGAYQPATKERHFVITSGQLPLVNGELTLTGKVGAEVDTDQAKAAARVCALNALAAGANAAGGLDNLTRVVEITGFVASDPNFTAQPEVLNGASELFGEIFANSEGHARSAVGVAVLPLNSPVEVSVVFAVKGGCRHNHNH